MFEAWTNLSSRERRLVALAAAVIALALGWGLVWQPLDAARDAARARISRQLALLDWLDRIEPQVERMRAGRAPERSMDGRSALSIVDQSARRAGLAGALKRIEPVSEGEIRVAFEQSAFPDLMGWLQALVAERPLAVERLDADRGGQPGRVDSIVVLRRTDVAGPG
ncbi:MAG: type II secretion system protein GspM [Wenzhouxiangellaceae bacterium]|nr:type II secretion system protein GspM [Wenzhouxiangellaceae bacterium]